MPALAGRRSSEGIVLSNDGARFSAREAHPGSARDWAKTDTHEELPAVRDFADIPSSCAGGEQPLLTVRVTNFADGTSAIGIASPHSLMDGKSYFGVVSAIAAAHSQGGSFDKVIVPDFDAAAVWEEKTKDLNIDDEPTLWVPFKLLTWTEPLWALLMRRIDGLMPRARVHISREELDDLKAAVSHTLQPNGAKPAKGKGGGGSACTTNEALSAAFFHALAEEPTGPFTPGKPKTVRMVVNVQGKGAFAGVDNVAGNFSWMEWMKIDPKPRGETASMAEVAQLFVSLGAKWRDEASSNHCVDEFARFFRIQDLKGTSRVASHQTLLPLLPCPLKCLPAQMPALPAQMLARSNACLLTQSVCPYAASGCAACLLGAPPALQAL